MFNQSLRASKSKSALLRKRGRTPSASEVIGNAYGIRRHSDLEKQGGVHGDVMYSKLSLDATLI